MNMSRNSKPKKKFRLALLDTGSPMGFNWHAIDIKTEETIGKSFDIERARSIAEEIGYIEEKCQSTKMLK